MIVTGQYTFTTNSAGGRERSFPPELFTTIYVYDPAADKWTKIPGITTLTGKTREGGQPYVVDVGSRLVFFFPGNPTSPDGRVSRGASVDISTGMWTTTPNFAAFGDKTDFTIGRSGLKVLITYSTGKSVTDYQLHLISYDPSTNTYDPARVYALPAEIYPIDLACLGGTDDYAVLLTDYSNRNQSAPTVFAFDLKTAGAYEVPADKKFGTGWSSAECMYSKHVMFDDGGLIYAYGSSLAWRINPVKLILKANRKLPLVTP